MGWSSKFLQLSNYIESMRVLWDEHFALKSRYKT